MTATRGELGRIKQPHAKYKCFCKQIRNIAIMRSDERTRIVSGVIKLIGVVKMSSREHVACEKDRDAGQPTRPMRAKVLAHKNWC
jgi:hypothetical protein